MIPTDGSGSFDPVLFRNSIKYAMQMGAPSDPTQRAEFVFRDSSPTYWKDGDELLTAPRLDREGKPFDPSVEVRQSSGERVSVDCSVTYPGKTMDSTTPVGFLGDGQVAVTLLDDDYSQVRGCYMMVHNQDEHLFLYERSTGLFGVDIHTMVFYTKDEN